MTLFLLLSAPVWLLLVASFYNSRNWTEILKFFLGGLCIGMVVLLITLGRLSHVPFRMDAFGLLRWVWLRSAGLPLLLAIPIVFIACIKDQSPYSRIPEITACLVGIVLLYNTWHGIMQDSGFYIYRVFISPIIWIGTMALIAWLLDRGLYWNGAPRYLVLATSILLLFVINLLPLIYANNRHYLTWIIGVAFSIVAGFLVFLDSRN